MGLEGALCPSFLQGASFGGGTEPQSLFLGSLLQPLCPEEALLPQQLGIPGKWFDLSVMRGQDCPPRRTIIRIVGNR